MFSIKRLFRSFADAGRGLRFTFRNEQNFRLQIFISLLMAVAVCYFPLRVWEIILIILLVVMVLTMELLNTALEYYSDLLKPRLHHYVQAVKDIMAAAVLLTALGAFTIGLIIFLPHLINLFK